MYKIMIVDDEPFVRIGFKMSVDWKKHGFEIVAEASDGREALEKIEQCRPDIIFTDIKMPVMDGIELIRIVRKAYPQIVSIVLSNYGEFDLVKQAMKAGAEDYFLKVTIDVDKLLGFLHGLEGKLDANRTAPLNARAGTAPHFSFFSKEANPIHIGNIPSILESDHELPPFGGSAFFLSFPAYSDFVEKRCENSLSKAMNLLSSTICSAVTCSQNALILYERDKWILLMNSGRVPPEEAQRSAAQEIRFALQQYLGLDCNVGFGPTYHGEDGLKEILNRSGDCFDRAFFQENVFRLCLAERRAEQPPLPQDSLESLNETVGRFRLNHVPAEVESLVEKAEKCCVEARDFKEYVIRLLMMLELRLTSYSPSRVCVGAQDYIGKIYGACSSGEVLRTAMSTVDGFLKQVQASGNHHRNEVIQAIEYVEKHYGEKLTLQETADHIHISKNYLSAIFKKEYGLSFQDYLIKFRMEKAAQLLLSSSMRVSEVCEKVGYGDIFYFDRSFKRYFNQSPKEFRDSVKL